MPGRILLITTDYPPLAGTNTRRVDAFARHLPSFGWQPHVLTLAIEDMRLIESGWTEDEARDTTRVRSASLQALMRRLKGGRPAVTGQHEVRESRSAEGRPSNTTGWLLAPARALWSLVVQAERATYVPDPLRPWAFSAAHAARRLLTERPADMVMTSSPPFSAHLVGLQLKRRLGIPWVADFRDLWVGRPYRELPYRWQTGLDRRYEARVVAAADRIVLASPAWVENLCQRYGSGLEARLNVITNGYEEAGLAETGQDAPRDDDRLRLVYTGALHRSALPWPLLEALVRARSELGADRVRRLDVRLIGPAYDDLAGIMDFVEAHGLSDIVRLPGPLSHEECLREQRAADVLLLFSEPLHTGTIRAKAFEYMATGKPILAMVPVPSIQADLLRHSGVATVVRYGDSEEAFQTLTRLIQQGAPVVNPDWRYIRSFTRRALTGELAGILDDVVGERGDARNSHATATMDGPEP